MLLEQKADGFFYLRFGEQQNLLHISLTQLKSDGFLTRSWSSIRVRATILTICVSGGKDPPRRRSSLCRLDFIPDETESNSQGRPGKKGEDCG